MNILKLIKAQTKTSKKAVALKQSVVDGVIVNIDSAQAIARVVHTAAFTRWDAAQDKAAVEAFKAAQDKTGIRYQFMSRAGRKDVPGNITSGIKSSNGEAKRSVTHVRNLAEVLRANQN